MLLLAWLGCAPKALPDPDVWPAPPLALPEGCIEPYLHLSVSPGVVDLTGDPPGGVAVLTLRSCLPLPIAVGDIVVDSTDPTSWAEGTPALAPGEVLGRELRLSREGTFDVSPIVGVSSGMRSFGHDSPTIRVVNTARDAAIAACTACDGFWGAQGMARIEGCNCRTRDGGEPCDRDDDCEAGCIRRGDDEPFRCATYAATYGCYEHRPVGARRGYVYEVCAD